MSFSCKCKASSYICILNPNPAKLHETNSENVFFIIIIPMNFTWHVVAPRYLWVLVIRSGSYTVFLARLPEREGVTARENIETAGATFPHNWVLGLR